MRRLIARALWKIVECCFLCGREGRVCTHVDHRQLGTIAQPRRRRWAPAQLASLVDWRRILPTVKG